MNLRCFVAMAFGKQDADKVYDKIITKSLERHQITSIRIDRKEHNNDIDDEILSELQKCDIIISDLTYARPSVYFEAGFGVGYSTAIPERKKPVIYTCRIDHRSGKNDDEFGNRRIHFDLQMKNIIFWKDHKDKDFIKKLNKRIELVISPLLKTETRKQDETKKIQRFTNLSPQTKIKKVFSIAKNTLPKKGFSGIAIESGTPFDSRDRVHEKFNINYPYGTYSPKDNLLIPIWLGTKVENGIKKVIYFHICQSITKSLIDYLTTTILKNPTYDIHPKPKGKKIKGFEEVIVITSFNPSNSKKIMQYLDNFSYNVKSEFFISKRTQLVPKKTPVEWKNLFHITNAGYDRFGACLKYDPRQKREKYAKYRQSGNFLSYRKKRSTYGYDAEYIRLKALPRTIKIKILDSIKHEDQFIENFSNFLSKTTSTRS